jgi:hypothetical protein
MSSLRSRVLINFCSSLALIPRSERWPILALAMSKSAVLGRFFAVEPSPCSYRQTLSVPVFSSNAATVDRSSTDLLIMRNVSRLTPSSDKRPSVLRLTSDLNVQKRLFHQEPYPPSQPLSASTTNTSSLPLSTTKQSPLHGIYASRSLWLGLYFAINLALTLHNKCVLIRFPFPYTLTAVHMLVSAGGCTVLAYCNFFPLPELDNGELAIVATFSSLYTVNIAVSNASLRLVTIAVRPPVPALLSPTYSH